MTECEYYRELISRLADDQLNSTEYSALSAHMESCPGCSAEYALFAELSRLIKEDLPELPEGLHENIMAGVRRSAIVKSNRRRLPRRARYSIAAAACFAVVMLAAVGIAGEISGDGSMLRMSSRSAAMEASDVSIGSARAATSDFSIDEAGAANAAVYANMASPDVYYAEDEYLTDESEYRPTLTPDPYLDSAPAAEYEPAKAQQSQPEAASTQIESGHAAVASVQATPETAAPIPTLPALDISEAAILPAPVAPETPAPMVEGRGVALDGQELPVLIDMAEGEHWSELMTLLAGEAGRAEVREKAALSVERASRIYTLALTVDGIRRELTVYVYGNTVYYAVPEPLADAGLYSAKCGSGAACR